MKIPSIMEPEVIIIHISVSYKLPARTRHVPYFVETFRLISIQFTLINLTKPNLYATEYIHNNFFYVLLTVDLSIIISKSCFIISLLTLWRRNYFFFFNFSTPSMQNVIKQEPNKLAL